MELNLDDKGSNPILSMIQNIVFSDNLLSKLRATDVVINALDMKVRERTQASQFQRYIHSLFADKPFMRKLSYISLMKTNIEVGLEYLGFDYISNPDFQYDEEIEDKMGDIEKRLAKFLGQVMAELNKGMDIEL